MIAFDSNVLIYFLEDHPEFGDRAENIFYEVERRGGVCSAAIITESMRGALGSKKALGPILSDSVAIIPLTENIAEAAGRIKIKHGLSNIDAIHIASAINGGAKEFVTNDKKLLKAKIEGLTVRGL